MSAPLLGGPWQASLLALQPGWDGDDGHTCRSISPEAIATVERFAVVPCSNGGVQVEIHRDRFDIEIRIAPDGRVESAFVCAEAPNP